MTQHLANALVPIRREGGLAAGADRIVPRPLLVGRDAQKLKQIAAAHGLDQWSTDLDAALSDPDFPVFFDAAATHQRRQVLERAITAGKHVYTEKPVALTAHDARALLAAARAASSMVRSRTSSICRACRSSPRSHARASSAASSDSSSSSAGGCSTA